MHERNEIDKVFFEQRHLLKHSLPIETLGGPPPPKGDPVTKKKDTSVMIRVCHSRSHFLSCMYTHGDFIT